MLKAEVSFQCCVFMRAPQLQFAVVIALPISSFCSFSQVRHKLPEMHEIIDIAVHAHENHGSGAIHTLPQFADSAAVSGSVSAQMEISPDLNFGGAA